MKRLIPNYMNLLRNIKEFKLQNQHMKLLVPYH